jgi:predicted O-methyltransferase YrrM
MAPAVGDSCGWCVIGLPPPWVAALQVADPVAVAADKATAALNQLNAKLLKDGRVSLSILPVGDGMALCRKR